MLEVVGEVPVLPPGKQYPERVGETKIYLTGAFILLMCIYMCASKNNNKFKTQCS